MSKNKTASLRHEMSQFRARILDSYDGNLWAHPGPGLAGVLCVRARRQTIYKGGRGTQIILTKFYKREKLAI
jgi:hypothetical protein